MRAVFAPALVMLASLAPVSPHDACDPLSHASPLPTTCPVPTPTLSFVQDRLRRDFREKIASITVDPERDTPDGLREDGRREYAQAFGVNLVGLAFLTRPPAVVRDVTRRYGVLCRRMRMATWTIRSHLDQRCARYSAGTVSPRSSSAIC